ncbi:MULTISPECIES: helix-turn-helix domain-containing protein [unclassified Streptomyces]|uniref:PucR family transcriptional regulator n=1 Tax=unclassified Streptomyces TaxID=2593676 RepID=UPI002DDB5C71|nr:MULTISPECIES: helix-turn-helix domain-containing protein [unclassified Streptomyces]WSB81255.1 helix-turn-helix domain-containing protein [Streptomyces sp. NBC_01775]WSS10537.1 helix-turn-helix domain-containing protein [Streptomyces sp. NBC_01186]WSS39231.1 helix-turn-helix domain-containing protein [Streptomyces sp. NBC_01187]
MIFRIGGCDGQGRPSGGRRYPMLGGRLQDVVDDLAERIGRSVAVNDPRVHILCASRHFGDEDEVRVRAVLQRDAGSAAAGHILAQGVDRWTEPGVIPPRADLGMRARLCAPIRWRHQLLGLLIVIDPDGSLPCPSIDAVTAATRTLAPLMYRDFAADDSERMAREGALRQLLNPSATARETGRDALARGGRLPSSRYATVTVARVVGDPPADRTGAVEVALRTGLERVAADRSSRAEFCLAGPQGMLLAFTDRPMPQEQLRARASALLGQARSVLAGTAECVAGIGEAVEGGAEAAWMSCEQAIGAARAAGLRPGGDGIVHWEELGALAPLSLLPPDRLTPALLPGPLRTLLAQDPSGRLTETLGAYLDHGGSAPRTAHALHLHRTSLYYRLQRIAELTGLDLADGDNRLALHLGLRLHALMRTADHA